MTDTIYIGIAFMAILFATNFYFYHLGQTEGIEKTLLAVALLNGEFEEGEEE